MSRQKKNVVGEIGFCDNKALGLKDKYGNPLKGGHYVYIREMNGYRCNVNVITSLETVERDKRGYVVKDKYGNPQMQADSYKIEKVKRGLLYPVPKPDADFTRWSAINLDGNINDVKISEIKNIGQKKMKRRHKWFVGKYHK